MHAPVLRATLVVSGHLVMVDGAWAAVLGWSASDLAGSTFIERVHPDDQEQVVGAIHGVYGSGAPVGFICRCAHRDGVYLRIAWEATPQPGCVELDLAGQPLE